MNPSATPAQTGHTTPSDAAALRAVVQRRLAAAAQDVPGTPLAPPKMLLVPDGDLDGAGRVAAHGFSLLSPWADRIRRVVLLGPVPPGQPTLRGLAAPGVAALATPLGAAPLDRAGLGELDRLRPVVWTDEPVVGNAALLSPLPFLQVLLPAGFTLLPLAVGEAGAQEVADVLDRLWGGDETLVVVSSSLSRDLPAAEARAGDRATVQRILQYGDDIGAEDAHAVCAVRGAVLAAHRHGLAPRLLALRHQATCDTPRAPVIGLAAIAFDPAPVAPAAPGEDPALGAMLLDAARQGLAEGLAAPSRYTPSPAPAPDGPAATDDDPLLRRPGATFVTLRDAQGRALGRAGRLEATRALGEDVRANARSAASVAGRGGAPIGNTRDGLQLEIALLEPAVPLAVGSEAEAAAALQPGRDGLILDWRGARVTLLPDAWEQHPQPTEFLAALKRQAGLPADFWARDLRLSRYRTRRFSGSAR